MVDIRKVALSILTACRVIDDTERTFDPEVYGKPGPGNEWEPPPKPPIAIDDYDITIALSSWFSAPYFAEALTKSFLKTSLSRGFLLQKERLREILDAVLHTALDPLDEVRKPSFVQCRTVMYGNCVLVYLIASVPCRPRLWAQHLNLRNGWGKCWGKDSGWGMLRFCFCTCKYFSVH